MNRKGEKSKKNRKKTPQLEEKSYITRAKKIEEKLKGLFFSFLGIGRGERGGKTVKCFTKKN